MGGGLIMSKRDKYAPMELILSTKKGKVHGEGDPYKGGKDI